MHFHCLTIPRQEREFAEELACYQRTVLLLYAWFFYHFVGSLIDFMEFLWIWGVFLPVSLIFILLNILMTSQKYATMYVNKVYVMYLCYITLCFFSF